MHAAPPVAPPSVWLLTKGWRRLGLLRIDELPQIERSTRRRRSLADASRRCLARR
jgi:hypothetical protein